MKKGNVLTLTTVGVSQKVKRGTFELLKGKIAPYILAAVTVPINNATAGAVVLSEAQKTTLLSRFIGTLTYGAGGHRKPYNALPFSKLRALSRFALGQDFAGVNDSSTGLAKSLPATATTAVKFWAAFPTGGLHQLEGRRVWKGLGRSMADTVEMDIKYDSASIDTSISISGNVVVEFVPYQVSAKGDRGDYMPEFFEMVEKDKKADLPPGLPLLVAEMSAAHAASLLSNVLVTVDQEVIHDNVSASEILVEYENNPLLMAEASVTDVWTVLYGVGPGVEWVDLPTGGVRVEQLSKDLSEMSLGYYYVPIVDDDKVRADCAAAATFRNKPLRCSSVASLEGLEMPDRLSFASPWRNLDAEDEEFERSSGLFTLPGSSLVAESVGSGVLEMARAQLALFQGTGETKRKERVYRKVAAASPGAVQSARGFSGGSKQLQVYRQLLDG